MKEPSSLRKPIRGGGGENKGVGKVITKRRGVARKNHALVEISPADLDLNKLHLIGRLGF